MKCSSVSLAALATFALLLGGIRSVKAEEKLGIFDTLRSDTGQAAHRFGMDLQIYSPARLSELQALVDEEIEVLLSSEAGKKNILSHFENPDELAGFFRITLGSAYKIFKRPLELAEFNGPKIPFNMFGMKWIFAVTPHSTVGFESWTNSMNGADGATALLLEKNQLSRQAIFKILVHEIAIKLDDKAAGAAYVLDEVSKRKKPTLTRDDQRLLDILGHSQFNLLLKTGRAFHFEADVLQSLKHRDYPLDPIHKSILDVKTNTQCVVFLKRLWRAVEKSKAFAEDIEHPDREPPVGGDIKTLGTLRMGEQSSACLSLLQYQLGSGGGVIIFASGPRPRIGEW